MPAKRKRSKKEKVGEKEQLLKELRGKVSVAQDIIVHGKHVKNYIQHNQQLAREIRNRQSEIQNQLKKVATKKGRSTKKSKISPYKKNSRTNFSNNSPKRKNLHASAEKKWRASKSRCAHRTPK